MSRNESKVMKGQRETIMLMIKGESITSKILCQSFNETQSIQIYNNFNKVT